MEGTRTVTMGERERVPIDGGRSYRISSARGWNVYIDNAFFLHPGMGYAWIVVGFQR